MASDKHLLDIATRHQVYLERLKSGQVKSMGTALRRLEKAITEVVGGLGVANMADLTKKQLNETLVNLRNVQTKIMLEMLDDLMPALEELAGYEAEFEAKSIEQAVAAVSLTVPAASAAYQAALKQPLSATGELLEPFLKGWTAKEVAAVNNLVRKGYADGWTNQQLVQAIRGTKKLNYSDGIIARIGRNADAVIRTAIQHVASTARMETWAKNSDIIKGYRWVSTLDNRTTPICRSLDGQVFELGRGPRPPVHIRCRSTTVAVVDPKYDFLDEGATRSSASGYVDGDLTYYEWLKTQPEAFQDSVLGPTRGKLLRDGGLTAEEFARLNLGRNFEPLTLEEMRKLEPTAFARAGLLRAESAESSTGSTKLVEVFEDNSVVYAANLLPQKWATKKASSFRTLAEAYEHDVEQRDKLIDLLATHDKHKVGVQTIPLKKLFTYQSTVAKEAVEKYAESFDLELYNKGDPATVFKLPDGSYLLKDGNHRVNAAILAGIKELPFQLFEIR